MPEIVFVLRKVCLRVPTPLLPKVIIVLVVTRLMNRMGAAPILPVTVDTVINLSWWTASERVNKAQREDVLT